MVCFITVSEGGRASFNTASTTRVRVGMGRYAIATTLRRPIPHPSRLEFQERYVCTFSQKGHKSVIKLLQYVYCSAFELRARFMSSTTTL